MNKFKETAQNFADSGIKKGYVKDIFFKDIIKKRLGELQNEIDTKQFNRIEYIKNVQEIDLKNGIIFSSVLKIEALPNIVIQKKKGVVIMNGS